MRLAVAGGTGGEAGAGPGRRQRAAVAGQGLGQPGEYRGGRGLLGAGPARLRGAGAAPGAPVGPGGARGSPAAQPRSGPSSGRQPSLPGRAGGPGPPAPAGSRGESGASGHLPAGLLGLTFGWFLEREMGNAGRFFLESSCLSTF